MSVDPNEKLLIEGCKAGKPAAQKALYTRFASEMLVVCMRYTKSKTEAEDILQEAFIRIFRSVEGFRGDSSLFFWVKRIVVNTALNHYRKNKRHLYLVSDESEEFEQVNPQTLLADMHWKDLLMMIQELPWGCQQIFNLYAIEGYTHKEIAEMLEISEGTSKSQFSRARQLLQARIGKEKNRNYGTAG